ncbi:MAG TPA: class I SAM-dependent methyltransferase, partial [Myxococcota bacterium]|nr:class I SAM-dependent methyltransferase [Myxococcota bacterium]
MTAPGASSDPFHPRYVPAPSFDLQVPFYPPLVAWLLKDDETRGRLIEQARIGAGHQVLEIGCGRGELAMRIKLREPNAYVYALDPNPQRLARAMGKSLEAGLPIRVYRGVSQRLPFPTEAIDRVMASLMLHRLTRAEKLATFREAHRVLYFEGSVHVLDFAPPVTRWEALLVRCFHRGERMQPHLAGEIPALMEEAGLVRARETHSVSTPIGRL